MTRTDAGPGRNGGDVDALGFETGGDLGGCQLLLLGGEGLRDLTAPLPDELAEGRLVLGSHLPHRGVQDGERRAVCDMSGSRRLQLGGISGRSDRFECGRDGGFDRFRGDFGRLRHETGVYRDGGLLLPEAGLRAGRTSALRPGAPT
jgi:hypothetical protein